jgi:hypothetical protein
MHVRSLFLVLLFASLSGTSSAQSARPQLKTEPLVCNADSCRMAGDSGRSVVRDLQRYPLSEPLIFSDAPTCYTMRSYIFAPEAPGSDVMRLVRERTCTPARKFSSWLADRPVEGEAPGTGVKLTAPVVRQAPRE